MRSSRSTGDVVGGVLYKTIDGDLIDIRDLNGGHGYKFFGCISSLDFVAKFQGNSKY